MRTIILAGGRGTRMGPTAAPKPLLKIGDRPVLAHVIDIYRAAGVSEFIVLAGHRFDRFRSWIERLGAITATELGDRVAVTDDLGRFSVDLVDTDEATESGGRLGRLRTFLDEPFFLTYADGLADVDLEALLALHHGSGAAVTLTAFPLELNYGIVDVDEGSVLARGFQEKPTLEQKWCNGGFYVVDPVVIEQCTDDAVSWEQQVLPKVAADGSLGVFRHSGFWASMDFAHQHQALQTTWRDRGPIWLPRNRG